LRYVDENYLRLSLFFTYLLENVLLALTYKIVRAFWVGEYLRFVEAHYLRFECSVTCVASVSYVRYSMFLTCDFLMNATCV